MTLLTKKWIYFWQKKLIYACTKYDDVDNSIKVSEWQEFGLNYIPLHTPNSTLLGNIEKNIFKVKRLEIPKNNNFQYRQLKNTRYKFSITKICHTKSAENLSYLYLLKCLKINVHINGWGQNHGCFWRASHSDMRKHRFSYFWLKLKIFVKCQSQEMFSKARSS